MVAGGVLSPARADARPRPAAVARAGIERRSRAPDVAARRALLVAMLVLALGLAVRLHGVADPAVGFHATRQYRSFLIARAYHVEAQPAVPAWQREVVRASRERLGLLEPPVMERLVAALYGLVGERVWVPRVVSSVAWLLGGLCLYGLARRLAGTTAALAALAFHAFAPFAIVASRSFQPDPLMVMLLLAGTLAVWRQHEAPSGGRWAAAVAVTALAVLVKPPALFPVLGMVAALAVWRHRGARALGPVAAFAGASLLPALAYYAHGILTGALGGQAEASFLPHLALGPFFWKGWLAQATAAVGLGPLALALAGVLLVRAGAARAAVVGLWAGYGAFCLAFAYHVATHDYYHLPLVPIVALSLGPPVAVLARRVVRTNRPWPWRAAAAALGLALVAGAAASGVARAGAGADPAEPRTAAEIGAIVRHTPRAVVLAADYGGALEYHGRLAGWPWPLASDLEWERLAGVPPLGAEERFRRWFAPLAPEYFVVADRRELDGQPDLATFLAGRYPVVASAERYVVFDLRAGALDRAAGAPGDGGPLAGGSR